MSVVCDNNSLHPLFFKGSLVNKIVLYRAINTEEIFAYLNGSLHGEKVLQTDGESVIYGSI